MTTMRHTGRHGNPRVPVAAAVCVCGGMFVGVWERVCVCVCVCVCSRRSEERRGGRADVCSPDLGEAWYPPCPSSSCCLCVWGHVCWGMGACVCVCVCVCVLQ